MRLILYKLYLLDDFVCCDPNDLEEKMEFVLSLFGLIFFNMISVGLVDTLGICYNNKKRLSFISTTGYCMQNCTCYTDLNRNKFMRKNNLKKGKHRYITK